MVAIGYTPVKKKDTLLSHANILGGYYVDVALVNDGTYTSELAAVQLLNVDSPMYAGIGFELRPIAKNIPDVLLLLYNSRN